MAKKIQSTRLTKQHLKTHGAVGIFGTEAKLHDSEVSMVSKVVRKVLEVDFPFLTFRYREEVTKREINEALHKVDAELGQTLFVPESRIKPDGGLVEVKDDNGIWRIVLVSEAKHQGKAIENIKAGVLAGKNADQDLMVAGNAIERAHKNIAEIGNLMLAESYFPYVLFLEGSNFLTHNISVRRPDGRVVTLQYNSGALNRLDRLTAANFGLPINTNLCKNKIVLHDDVSIMLQSASIYTQSDGGRWNEDEMKEIMLDVAKTSLQMLGRDLFKQLSAARQR